MVAAIAEALRFLAIVFLAYDLGALLNPSLFSFLRYAAVPQLLFAAGFFFLWLDPQRYAPYRPLLLIGKLATLLCFFPLALALLRDPSTAQLSSGPNTAALGFDLPFIGRAMALVLVLVDMLSLAVLVFGTESAKLGQSEAGGGGGASGPSKPGQGPGDIERVEDL
jgi:hypothetical protein